MLNLLQSYTQLKISYKGYLFIRIFFFDLVFEDIGCKRNINLKSFMELSKEEKKAEQAETVEEK